MKKFTLENALFLFIIVGFIALMLSIRSYAAGATANLSWSAPPTYTDSEAMPAGDIGYYTIFWTPVAGGGPAAGSLKVTGATSAVVPVPCGGETFSVSVTTSASAKYPNSSSAPSSAVPYASGIACTPNPPAGLTVQ